MALPEKTHPSRKSTSGRPSPRGDRAREAPRASGRPGPRRRPAPPPDDGAPVVSGRFYIAFALIAAAAIIPFWSGLGKAMAPKDPDPTDTSGWRTGNTTSMKLTLITADVNLLSCASDKVFEGRRCEYKDDKTPWPRVAGEPVDDNKRQQIQPYRTWPDNQLIMIAGLWAEPHVAMRLHREPPRGIADKKLARFVADCRMRFIGQIDSPKLRWGATGDFMQERATVPVAVAESCSVVTDFYD